MDEARTVRSILTSLTLMDEARTVRSILTSLARQGYRLPFTAQYHSLSLSLQGMQSTLCSALGVVGWVLTSQ
jgi:hypothetical protein